MSGESYIETYIEKKVSKIYTLLGASTARTTVANITYVRNFLALKYMETLHDSYFNSLTEVLLYFK